MSGWWTALSTSSQNMTGRAASPETQAERDGKFVIAGNLLEGGVAKVSAFGFRPLQPTAFEAGAVADIGDGQTLTVKDDGSYEIVSPTRMEGTRGQRIFYTAAVPPRFTFDNYREVMRAAGIGSVLHQLADRCYPGNR